MSRFLTPAEEALSIERRGVLIGIIKQREDEEKERAAPVTIVTPEKVSSRRARHEKTGPDPASTRDLAKKMGVSHQTISRAKKRAETLSARAPSGARV